MTGTTKWKEKRDEPRRRRREISQAQKALREYTAASLRGQCIGYLSSQQFQDDLANLDPKDRIHVYLDMLPYVFPKKQATTLELQPLPPDTEETARRMSRLARLYSPDDIQDADATEVT